MKFRICRQIVEMKKLYKELRKSRLFEGARRAIWQIRNLRAVSRE